MMISNEHYEKAIQCLVNAEELEKALEVAIKYHDHQTWLAEDGNCEVEYDLPDRSYAAQEYVDDGDWGELKQTCWINVYTWPRYYVGDIYIDDENDRESTMIAIDPEEPDCTSMSGCHNWQSPHYLVGGIKENPGVLGRGGGVIIDEACMACGCQRTTDTWAQCPDTGVQGLRSISYQPEYYDIPPEVMFKNRFASVAAAMEAEQSILSIGSEFLPNCALNVIAGCDPTDEYFEFLLDQCTD